MSAAAPPRRAREPLVLGVGGSHNGGACLLRGSRPVVAVQKERLTGVKRDWLWAGEEIATIRYCLEAAGAEPGDLDAIAVSGLPSSGDPRHDVRSNPVLGAAAAHVPVIEVGHHRAHAASAFGQCGSDDAAIIVCDGAGTTHGDLPPDERVVAASDAASEAVSMYAGHGERMHPVGKWLADGADGWLGTRDGGMRRFGTLGGMYAAVADQVFGDPHASGKVMGLAPYGDASIPVDEFLSVKDGRIAFTCAVADRFRHDDRWPARAREYRDLAASLQAALEVGLSAVVGELRRRLPGARTLCYAGGVALNVTANRRVVEAAGFDDVFIVPAADDSGIAVGAAYAGLWAVGGRGAPARARRDVPGCRYGDADVARALAAFPSLSARRSDDPSREACDALAAGGVVGWFQGGSELGPRALGRRSILCDPRDGGAKDRLNARVKYREPFRPFAPLVPAEDLAAWFDVAAEPPRPFMLSSVQFRADRRARVPAVVHADGSGRVQTVDAASEPLLHALLSAWRHRTGVPILINTSFNLAGEPIVETPEDALRCLMSSRINRVVIGAWVVERRSPDTLLDLAPVAGGRPADGAAGSRVVDTPWGPTTVDLDAHEAAIVACADGRLSGRELVSMAVPGVGDDVAIVLLHRLGRLRALDFAMSGRARSARTTATAAG